MTRPRSLVEQDNDGIHLEYLPGTEPEQPVEKVANGTELLDATTQLCLTTIMANTVTIITNS